MYRGIMYVIATPVVALAGSWVVFVLWNTMIRAELISNASLSWFPAFAVVWGVLCLGVAPLIYRAGSKGKAK